MRAKLKNAIEKWHVSEKGGSSNLVITLEELLEFRCFLNEGGKIPGFHKMGEYYLDAEIRKRELERKLFL